MATLQFELDVIPDSQKTSPCDGCHAGCCRAHAVPLTLSDIVRIAADRQLDFWNFVVRWADETGSIARGQVPHFHFDDEPQTPFVIGLMHTASDVYPGTTRCRFLQESVRDDGSVTGSCGIYESRPLACRIFPAVQLPTGEIGVVDIPESPTAVHEAFRLCPESWSVGDLSTDDARAQIEECRGEMELMSVLAERWNSNPGPWTLFPQFLTAVLEAAGSTS